MSDAVAIVSTSRYSYHDTLERVTQAIVGAGNVMFANIDQSGQAATVGLRLRPTTLLVFGNPRGGTPLMEKEPLIALDLPLKILVWESNGATQVAYTPVRALAERYGLTGMDESITAMDHALTRLVESVT